MRLKVGDITTTVRNRASPMTIWLPGAELVPMAWRRKPSTMTMRVKLVRRIRNAGAREMTVINRTIFRAESMPLGPATPSMLSVRAPAPLVLSGVASWAPAATAPSRHTVSNNSARQTLRFRREKGFGRLKGFM